MRQEKSVENGARKIFKKLPPGIKGRVLISSVKEKKNTFLLSAARYVHCTVNNEIDTCRYRKGGVCLKCRYEKKGGCDKLWLEYQLRKWIKKIEKKKI